MYPSLNWYYKEKIHFYKRSQNFNANYILETNERRKYLQLPYFHAGTWILMLAILTLPFVTTQKYLISIPSMEMHLRKLEWRIKMETIICVGKVEDKSYQNVYIHVHKIHNCIYMYTFIRCCCS